MASDPYRGGEGCVDGRAGGYRGLGRGWGRVCICIRRVKGRENKGGRVGEREREVILTDWLPDVWM